MVIFDLGELADGILVKVFVVDGCLVVLVVVGLVVDILVDISVVCFEKS